MGKCRWFQVVLALPMGIVVPFPQLLGWRVQDLRCVLPAPWVYDMYD